ncbi:24285_t:CDS:2 [Dentiscutata erythropus]|uniref:24285_t:CDS:1 n=1 Tax=Dentiscutata erythropus TaxID=1348616 RepID=A0A9N8VMD4_9GLOM|nr:24285_t:CDS:2 [Dentiscutata erythropus]
MFGRIDLLNKLFFNWSSRILLIWLTLSQVCNASLLLYNKSHELIESYSTVDFMWIDTPSSFEMINGTITIASFSNNNSCTLNSVPINTVILLVPFNEGLNYGCSSYADIIENNIWLQTINQPVNVNATVISSPSTTQQSTMTNEYIATNSPTKTKNQDPSITMIEISYETESLARPNKRVIKEHIKPRNIIKYLSLDSLNSQPQIKVVIFTSMNNGDPGIKENYVARKSDLVPIVEPNTPRNNEQNGRTSQRNNEQIRMVRMNKKIFEAGVLTMSLILSFLFITVHTLVTAFLSPTILNFWITRITDDVSFIIGCIVLLITLHSDSISKYSHMTYASSPEESSTENSQNPSRSSSNGGGTNIQDRPRRNTLEILFGRRKESFTMAMQKKEFFNDTL